MEIGNAEISLLISGTVCMVGVMGFFSNSRERRDLEAKENHAKDLETHEWRVEMRGAMNQHSQDLSTIKREQREMRDEMKDNVTQIHDLRQQHTEEVNKLSRRLDRVEAKVNDITDVVASMTDEEMEDENE